MTTPISPRTNLSVQSMMSMRARLDDLQRQLGTGKRSDTYAGLGLERGLSVGLRSHLSSVDGYNNAITTVSTRINLAVSTLERIGEIGQNTTTAIMQTGYDNNPAGAIGLQQSAVSSLGEMLGLLNTQAGEHYLFSGRATDQPAVENLTRVLDGDGARAGLRQLVSERRQADLGASGLGRLAISSPTATSVALTQDSATSPFGFKLTSIGSSLTGSTVSGPTGAPPSVSVGLTSNPAAGETVRFSFTLPDGSSEAITLTATSGTPGANQFAIGATPADTATNLRNALNASLGKLASTSLTAASAVAASGDFFNADAAHPPQRVDGPPFDTATALKDGTATDTVSWYLGDAGSDGARTTAAARIDQSISVAYGARATEDGIRSVLINIGALAATSISSTDPNAVAMGNALSSRIRASLSTPTGQTVNDIQMELAGAQIAMKAATDRHKQTAATLGDFLQQIEGVSNEEIGAQFMALQTRLQASLQTTAILYQTSLVNYL